jgi:hypothetical protein
MYKSGRSRQLTLEQSARLCLELLFGERPGIPQRG